MKHNMLDGSIKIENLNLDYNIEEQAKSCRKFFSKMELSILYSHFYGHPRQSKLLRKRSPKMSLLSQPDPFNY